MSLVIRKMQIETSMWYHLTPVRMAIINKSKNKGWWGCEKGEPFCTVGRNADWCSHCGNSMEIPRKIKSGSTFWPRIPTSGNISKGTQNTNLKELKHPYVHCSIIYNCQDTEAAKCPSIDEWIKQLWDIYTMEFYSAMKKKKILPFATVWMDLENIMITELSQSEKDKYHMISLICGI